MRIISTLILFAVLISSVLADAKVPVREIRRSPNGRYFVAWFDYEAGAPIGLIRPVMIRSTSDPYDIFSFVSIPRSTDAAWNTASTQCVIADAPDNGGPTTWLIYRKRPQEWASKVIDPFTTLYESFRKTDPEIRHLFRPSILKITWLSDTKVQFRGYCNTGTYLITIDTTKPNQSPLTKKLSDECLDE